METLLTKKHYDHLLLLKITYCKPHESASGSSWFCHNDECGEKGHKNPDQQNAAKLSATGFDHWGVPMKAKDDYGCNRDEHSYTSHTKNVKIVRQLRLFTIGPLSRLWHSRLTS